MQDMVIRVVNARSKPPAAPNDPLSMAFMQLEDSVDIDLDSMSIAYDEIKISAVDSGSSDIQP